MDYKVRFRITVLFVLLVMAFGFVVYKIASIQIEHGEELRSKVNQIMRSETILYPERGPIKDRNGETLAYNRTVYDIKINKKNIEITTIDENNVVPPKEDEVKADEGRISVLNTELNKPDESFINMVKKVADIMKIPESDIYNMLMASESNLVKLETISDRDKARALRQTYSPKLQVEAKISRKYPFGSLAADVLGLTRPEGDFSLKGTYGMEDYMDDYLKGTNGILIKDVDYKKIELVYSDSTYEEEKDGDQVYLTIDSFIQRSVEDALISAYETWLPKAAHAIVMNVNTGEILAMASYPTFNPETRSLVGYPEEYLNTLTDEEFNTLYIETLNNDNISSSLELGSTVKLVTASIALEEGFYTPDSQFDEENHVDVLGTTLSCWYAPKTHGEQSLMEAVGNSCNPVFIKIGLTIGKEVMDQYFEKFGLKDKIDMDYPSGSISKPRSFTLEGLNPVELATLSFGHGATYTPLHMATAISAIVNGGELLRPQLVKKVETADGVLIFENKKVIRSYVISEITSQQMRTIMEFVVDEKTGKQAQIEGLRIGGKTGTAEKIIDGAYSKEKGYASFVGVMPIDKPEVLVYIVVDEPTGSMMGSAVAAPIAKEILEDIADYYEYERHFVSDDIEVAVPYLVGSTYKEALKITKDLGLLIKVSERYVAEDDSIITEQYPLPGTNTNLGTAILVEIE